MRMSSMLRQTGLMLLLIVVLIFGSLLSVSAAPTVDVVNVKDCGAIGNGVADDTTAFQNAISLSTSQKKPIYVPYGTYKITQALSLTNQLVFGEPSGSWSSDSATLPTIKQTSTTQSAFILNAGGSISGLNFDYEQNLTGTPIQFAATVLLNGVGTRVSNVRIYHAWIGIDCASEANTGRTIIEDVFISHVAKMGIRLTGGWDVSTLHNVEVWTPSNTYGGYFGSNGIGFKFEFNDCLRVSDAFAYGASVGILFEQTGVNGTWGNLTNVSSDFCAAGLKLLGTHHITVSGGSLWSHFNGVYVDGEYAELMLTGADIRSNGLPAVWVNNAFSVTITGSNITRTDLSHAVPTIEAPGSSYMNLNGNMINGTVSGVKFGSRLYNVIVTNNIINVTDGSGIGVVNNGPPNIVQIVNNNIIK